MFRIFALASIGLGLLPLFASASPFPEPTAPIPVVARSAANPEYGISKRADPFFPPTPPSCPLCATDWSSIQTCANSCAVFANPALIIFQPSTFVDVIRCSCTDTFKAVFPQCVDCFQQTNQTELLNAPDIPAVLQGMRQICALSSALLGGVATHNSQVIGETPISVPLPTAKSEASRHNMGHNSRKRLWIAFGAAAALVGGL